jgi:septum formation protein
VAFSVSAVGFDDAHLDPGTERDAGRWAQALACLKADAVARTLRAGGQAGGAWVLAADTIVVHAGRMIGKPRDADDAERLIRSMLNDTHEVVTGCAVVRADAPERWLFADRARVTMGGLSDRDLADYLASGRWAGKAGAYNLDEQARAGWPLRWEGDPATVVGLPMQRLEPFLARFAGAKA